MTLSSGEGYAIAATLLVFLTVGFVTGRAAVCLVPLLGVVGFLGATIASNDLYSRIPEDVQATVVLALGGGAATTLLGALMRRLLAEGRRNRTGG